MADPTEPVPEPVRDRYEIKTEIDEAQQDLEQNLGELKEAILEKVDLKARVEHAIDAGKDKAMDYAVRAREVAIDLYAQGRRFVRENPMVVVGVLGGIALIAGAAVVIRHRLAEPVTD